MQDTTVTLGGEEWEIRFVRRRDLPKRWLGSCDREKRLIMVRKDVCLRTMLDTLIHEMRHAQHPVLFEAEGYVNWTSTELAVGLIKAGVVG